MTSPISYTMYEPGNQAPFIYEITTGGNQCGVWCGAIDPGGSGSFVIGGTFTTAISGVSVSGSGPGTYNYLAMYSRNGILNTSFNAQISYGSSIGVFAVQWTSAGIYIGGTFATINGSTRQGLALLNATTGALQSWNPALGAGTAVNALAVDSGGTHVYVGTNTGMNCITSGTNDTAWTPNIAGSSPYCSALIVQGSGTSTMVYAGGYWQNIKGPGGSTVTKYSFAQINGRNGNANDGQATTWNLNLTNGSAINQMCLDGQGNIIITTNSTTVLGTSRPYGLASIAISGPTLNSLNPPVSGSGNLWYSVGANTTTGDIYYGALRDGAGAAGYSGCSNTGSGNWDAKITQSYSLGTPPITTFIVDTGNPTQVAVWVAGNFKYILGNLTYRNCIAKMADCSNPNNLCY